MKTVILFLLIILLFCVSCKKQDLNPVNKEPYKNSLLIEEYIHDSTGIVFKIINDIDSAYNYQEKFNQKVDSVYLKKFHIFIGDTNMYSTTYTWFSKKGQYVCWRYNYIDGNSKLIDIGFPNHIRYYNPWKYCGFVTYIFCSEPSRESYQLLQRFPKPINDTVYCKLSSFFPDKLW